MITGIFSFWFLSIVQVKQIKGPREPAGLPVMQDIENYDQQNDDRKDQEIRKPAWPPPFSFITHIVV